MGLELRDFPEVRAMAAGLFSNPVWNWWPRRLRERRICGEQKSCLVRWPSCAAEMPVKSGRDRLMSPLSAAGSCRYPNSPSTCSRSSHTDSRSMAWHSSDQQSVASVRISSIVFTRLLLDVHNHPPMVAGSPIHPHVALTIHPQVLLRGEHCIRIKRTKELLGSRRK